MLPKNFDGACSHHCVYFVKLLSEVDNKCSVRWACGRRSLNIILSSQGRLYGESFYCHDPGVGPRGKIFNLGFIFWTMGIGFLYFTYRYTHEESFLLIPRLLILNFDLVSKNFILQACLRSYLKTKMCPKYILGHILVLSRFLEVFLN
jgi:hypothetical protein